MRKKTIDIPIYQCTLTMILDKDLSYIEKKYKTKSLSDFGAVTVDKKAGYRHYVVAFTDSEHLKNKNPIARISAINIMNSLDFCYWLQGFFEISKDSELKNLDENQVKTIKDHLQLVFKQETSHHEDISDTQGMYGTCGISQPN